MNRFLDSLNFSIVTCDEFYQKVRDFVYELSDFETSWFYLDHEATLILLALYDTIGFNGKIFKDIRNITDYYPLFYSIDEEKGFMAPLLDYITEKYRTYNLNKGFRIIDAPNTDELIQQHIWALLDKSGYWGGGEYCYEKDY